MHVVIATGIYPPEIGGPATAMASLVAQLKTQGHEALVVTTGGVDEEVDGIRRISRSRSKLVRTWLYARIIRKALRPDSVLVVTDVFSSGIPARLALVGKPNRFLVRLGGEWCWEDAVNKGMVVSLREYWSDATYRAHDRFKRPLIAWILKRAQKIVPTSDLIKDVLPQIVPGLTTPVVVLQNQERSYATSVIPHGRVPHQPLRLLYVGRFVPVKNLSFFAQVLTDAHREGLKLHTTFVGDGPERGSVEALLHGSGQATFRGTLDAQGVAEAMDEADLLVLPSVSDVSPNVVYEALGRGLPCVITSEHGLPRSMGGVVEASPRDEQAWIQAVRRLLDTAAYQALQGSIHLAPSGGRTFVDEVLSV